MTTSLPPCDRDARRAALAWAAAGLAVQLVLVAGALVRADYNPQWFVHFGPDYPGHPVARDVFGSDLLAPEGRGHDGQAFWLLARDPLLVRDDWDPHTHLDRPAYRAQRVAYPALASVWHLAGERPLLWGLLVTNLVVVFLGGYVTARLALALGGPARAGLAFALNPGVATATLLDVADALSLAALVACLLAAHRGRFGWAAAAGVLAVLAKESAIFPLAGAALLARGLPWRARALLVAVPGSAGAAWAGYVRWRLGWVPAGIQELAGPLQGYVATCRDLWVPERAWGHAAIAGMILFAAGAAVWRWRHRRSLALAAALPVACLVPFFSTHVLDLALNPMRAAAPLLTLLMLDVLSPGAPAPAANGPRPSSRRANARGPQMPRPAAV